MPDRTSLRVGDRLRILAVPECDLAQRDHEVSQNAAMAGWTADTIERIIATNPIVTVERIDEYGAPWFAVEFNELGGTQYHYLTILDDSSWEYCD
jgi:hypothetical protein